MGSPVQSIPPIKRSVSPLLPSKAAKEDKKFEEEDRKTIQDIVALSLKKDEKAMASK